MRAARYGFPLTLAIIGGSPQRFRPYVDLYLQSLEQFGKPVQPIAVHSPGHVAADRRAGEERSLAALRGDDEPDRRRTRLDARRAARTSSARPGRTARSASASPETVAAKIAKTVSALGLSRFDLKYSNGTLPHDMLMTSIELFGTKVAPRVRELLA